MKETGILFVAGLLALAHCLLHKEKGLYDWSLNNLGDAQYLHHYYSAGTLKGFFVVTHEGTLGLINARTGGLQWRRTVTGQREIDYAVFDGDHAIVVTDRNSSAELWHMGTGVLLASYALVQNDTKDSHVDVVFIKKKDEVGLEFALLSNQWVRIYKDKKEIHAIRAQYRFSHNSLGSDNQTFCVCFYEPVYDKLSVGLIYSYANELTIHSYDPRKNSLYPIGSFLFGAYDATLKKTWGHLLALRKNGAITFYSIVDAEALVTGLRAKLHSFHEPSEMIITEDPSNFYINLIKRRELFPMFTIEKNNAEYAFGASEDQKKLVFAKSTAGGMAIYLSEDEKQPALVHNFTGDFQPGFYGVPEKIWVDSRSDEMVVKTSDKSLHLIVGGRKVWTRQEGLAGVAKWAIGKATEKVPDKSSHEVMMTNPVSQFVGRIARQVGALVEGTSKLVELGKKLTSKTYVKSKQARVEDKNYLFALTKYSKMYAFKAADGRIVWQRVFPGRVSDFFYFAGADEDTIVVVMHYDEANKTVVQEIHPANGTDKAGRLELTVQIKNVVALTSKSLGEKLLLLLDVAGQAHSYPVSSKAFATALQRLTLCTIDREAGIVKGSRVSPKSLQENEVWRLSLREAGEEVLVHASDDQLDPDQYQGLEEIAGNIAYKYVDPNLMAMATFAEPNHLNIYVINRANGTILYTGHIYNVYGRESVKLSFVENTIVLTYLKKYSERATTLLNEVLIIELYFPNIENDVPQMISRYYSKGVQVGEASSNRLPAPRVVSQTYILPFPFKELTFTRTRQGITNRHALILTEQNQILAIPGAMLDAKRPTGNTNRGEALAFENPELPPYDAVIPISYTTTLTYDLTMSGLGHLRTLPHDFESTTLVVADGIDIFVSYFAPEKKYDRLSTEFNHWYLLLAVAGLIVTALVMSRIAGRKEAKESYLTN